MSCVPGWARSLLGQEVPPLELARLTHRMGVSTSHICTRRHHMYQHARHDSITITTVLQLRQYYNYANITILSWHICTRQLEPTLFPTLASQIYSSNALNTHTLPQTLSLTHTLSHTLSHTHTLSHSLSPGCRRLLRVHRVRRQRGGLRHQPRGAGGCSD